MTDDLLFELVTLAVSLLVLLGLWIMSERQEDKRAQVFAEIMTAQDPLAAAERYQSGKLRSRVGK